MSKIKKIILSFIIISSYLQSREIRFAIIDSMKISEHSIPFKKAKSRIEKQFSHYNDYVKRSHKTLLDKYNDLESNKSIISKHEYRRREKILKNDAEKQHNFLLEKRMYIDKMAEILQEKIGVYIKEIVNEICIVKKIDIILEKSNVTYSNDKIEITDYIISRLNKDFSDIDIDTE